MTREQMMDNVIKRYGFEVDETIGFCSVCEDTSISDFEVCFIYNLLMR